MSAAAVAAIYAALSAALAPISYGPVQLRIAEAMCILPFFLPFTTWGLFIGCIAANLLSMYGPIDIIFGSMATLMAACCTMMTGKKSRSLPAKLLACLPPVVFNGVIVGAVIAWAETSGDAFWAAFAFNGATVALGEAVVMYAVGLPLMIYLPKLRFFREMTQRFR